MLVCACILAISPSKPPLVPVASVGCANATSRVLLAAYATGAMFAGGSFRPLSQKSPYPVRMLGTPPAGSRAFADRRDGFFRRARFTKPLAMARMSS